MFNKTGLLYEKIAFDLLTQIARGDYGLNDKLPSVRDLAVRQKVNPLTIQKAYAILEAEKLVIAIASKGKFVTSDEKLLNLVKKELIDEKISLFIEDIKMYNIDVDQIISILENEK